VMIPTFSNGIADISSLPLLYAVNVWSHVILGTLAEILGFIIVGLWLSKPISQMACVKVRKWMMPLFIVWAISLVNGAILHIFQML
jgi:hypothetical protein